MNPAPIITKIEAIQIEHTLLDMGTDYNTFNIIYEPGGKLQSGFSILRIHTDLGIIGEYAGVQATALAEVRSVAEYLIGKNALSRESIYNDLKRALRHGAWLGLSVVDICLWDFAGKFYEAPLYRLLGGEKKPASSQAYPILRASPKFFTSQAGSNSKSSLPRNLSPNFRTFSTSLSILFLANPQP